MSTANYTAEIGRRTTRDLERLLASTEVAPTNTVVAPVPLLPYVAQYVQRKLSQNPYIFHLPGGSRSGTDWSHIPASAYYAPQTPHPTIPYTQLTAEQALRLAWSRRWIRDQALIRLQAKLNGTWGTRAYNDDWIQTRQVSGCKYLVRLRFEGKGRLYDGVEGRWPHVGTARFGCKCGMPLELRWEALRPVGVLADAAFARCCQIAATEQLICVWPFSDIQDPVMEMRESGGNANGQSRAVLSSWSPLAVRINGAGRPVYRRDAPLVGGTSSPPDTGKKRAPASPPPTAAGRQPLRPNIEREDIGQPQRRTWRPSTMPQGSGVRSPPPTQRSGPPCPTTSQSRQNPLQTGPFATPRPHPTGVPGQAPLPPSAGATNPRSTLNPKSPPFVAPSVREKGQESTPSPPQGLGDSWPSLQSRDAPVTPFTPDVQDFPRDPNVPAPAEPPGFESSVNVGRRIKPGWIEFRPGPPVVNAQGYIVRPQKR